MPTVGWPNRAPRLSIPVSNRFSRLLRRGLPFATAKKEVESIGGSSRRDGGVPGRGHG
jgi:hypothetical protein